MTWRTPSSGIGRHELSARQREKLNWAAPTYADADTGALAFSQKCVRPDLSVAPELGRPIELENVQLNAPARLRVGDLVVNSTGRGTLGRAAVVRELPSEPLVADGHVTVLRVKEERASPQFLASEDSGVPVLRGLNVRPGRVSADDLVYMSERSNRLHAKSVLRQGDVVVVRTGLAGAAALVPDWAVGGNAVDLLIVRPVLISAIGPASTDSIRAADHAEKGASRSQKPARRISAWISSARSGVHKLDSAARISSRRMRS